MGRLFHFKMRALGLRCRRRIRFVRSVEVPVIQGNPEPHGIVWAVQKPRIHVDADGAVLRGVLTGGRHGRHAVVKRNLPSVGIESNFHPCGIPPFLVFAFQVLVVFARWAKRSEGVRLSEPHVAIAVGESDYQFPAAACAEVKRLEFNRWLIREAGLRQTAAQRQKGSNQSNTEGGLRKVRCDFHRFDWHQS